MGCIKLFENIHIRSKTLLERNTNIFTILRVSVCACMRMCSLFLIFIPWYNAHLLSWFLLNFWKAIEVIFSCSCKTNPKTREFTSYWQFIVICFTPHLKFCLEARHWRSLLTVEVHKGLYSSSYIWLVVETALLRTKWCQKMNCSIRGKFSRI